MSTFSVLMHVVTQKNWARSVQSVDVYWIQKGQTSKLNIY